MALMFSIDVAFTLVRQLLRFSIMLNSHFSNPA